MLFEGAEGWKPFGYMHAHHLYNVVTHRMNDQNYVTNTVNDVLFIICHSSLSQALQLPSFIQGQGKGEEMIQFHNDLLETIVDLMSRYTYASCAPLPKR